MPATGRYTRPDPFNLGRLLNADPPSELDALGARLLAIGRAGNPKFEAVYGYAGNHPLLIVDPDGRALPLVCAAPWVLPALAEAVAVTITVVSATAAGIVVSDWWNDREDCDECEEKDPPGPCEKLLELCLINPWQPDWNKQIYGPREDCGACFRSCKNNGGAWPFEKCPLP